MDSKISLQQIRLSKNNKDQILYGISQEENVNIKHNIKETLFEFINRPMTLVNLYRRQFFFCFFRAALAITSTICCIYFNIHNDKMDRNTKTTLPILYFSVSFVFILSNLFFYYKARIIYINWNLKLSPSFLIVEELMRSLLYLSLPIMFSLIVFGVINLIWLVYIPFIIFGYLSNMSAERRKTTLYIFCRAALLVVLSLLFIFIPNILTLKYLRDNEMLIRIFLSYLIIFFSVFLVTQSKYMESIITNKTTPSFLIKVIGSIFLTNILMFTFYDIHSSPFVIYKWIAFGYNILISLVCLFIPCVFDTLQLKVQDRKKIRTRCNLINIFSIFDELDVEFKSFQHYYINLRKKLSKMNLEKKQQNICSYLNNNGGNTPTSLIDVIEDLAKFNINSNITFNGYFNYSPIRMVIPPTKEYWVNTINEEKDMDLQIERFRNLTIMEYLMEIVKIEYILFDISIPINIYLNKEETVNITDLEANNDNVVNKENVDISTTNNNETQTNKEVSNERIVTHNSIGDDKDGSSFIINNESPEQQFFSHLLPEDSDSMLLEKYDADSNDFQLHAKYENKENTKPVVISPVKEQNLVSSYSNIAENFDLSSNNTTASDSSIEIEPDTAIIKELIVPEKKERGILKNSEASDNEKKLTDNENINKTLKRKRRVTIIDPSLTYVARNNRERENKSDNNINPIFDDIKNYKEENNNNYL